MMMQITNQVMLDEISDRCDWGAWLKLVLEKVGKKLQNAKSVGRLITTGKEQAHADFWKGLIAKHGLNVNKGKENPWSLHRLIEQKKHVWVRTDSFFVRTMRTPVRHAYGM